MPLNSRTLNSGTLNAQTSTVSGVISGSIISINQTVCAQISGNLLQVQQSVILNQSISGNLFTIQQSVCSSASGNLIAISQNIYNPLAPSTFLSRNGYILDIFINGYQIPYNQLTGICSVKRTCGEAATASFKLIPSLGVQNLEQFFGLPVIINITTTTSSKRIFTGWIDNPTLDLIEQQIVFKCTDRRQTQINQLQGSVLSSIGYYSNYVFGDPKDQADELAKRLETVPMDFDFDAYGNYTITPWLPKTTADHVLSGSNIYYDAPNISYDSSQKALNTINITVNYKHQRLHQQATQVLWQGFADFKTDWYSQGTPNFPERTTIQSAANSTSWAIIKPIAFVDLWPAGGIQGIFWQPDTVTSTYVQKTITVPLLYYPPSGASPTYIWPDGLQHVINEGVVDAQGKPVYTVGTTTITNSSSKLCRGAQWMAGKKFSQNVTEQYSIRITSPSSISKFGIVDNEETININDPYNAAGWEKDRTIYDPTVKSPTAVNVVLSGSGYTKGSCQLTLLASGTGALYAGNQFTINLDPSNQIYTVASGIANVGAGGTITISQPGLGSNLQPNQYSITTIPTQPTYSQNYFIDQKPLYPQLATALNVVCQRAQTQVIKAHRVTRVNFKRRLWGDIDLKHTVQTTATRVQCQGKVESVSHTIDCMSGEGVTDVTLLLSRSFGTDTQSAYNITMPPYEDTSYIGKTKTVVLSTYSGFNVNTNIINQYSGWVCNATIPGTQKRTTFNQSFTVNYPPISTLLTNDRTITSNTPGSNSGVTTDSAGYIQGSTSVHLNTAGFGKINQGDSFTITGDSSFTVYTAQNDILNVSSGGVLSFSPGLGAPLGTLPYGIVSSPPANQFTLNIPNDPLTVVFS